MIHNGLETGIRIPFGDSVLNGMRAKEFFVYLFRVNLPEAVRLD